MDIKVYKEGYSKPRKAPNKYLPDLGNGRYLSALIVGAMGAGKSNLTYNILTEYANSYSYDYLFVYSKSLGRDPKLRMFLDGLKNISIIEMEKFEPQTVIEYIDEVNTLYKEYEVYKNGYAKFVKNRLESITDTELEILDKYQYAPVFDIYPKSFKNGEQIFTLLLDDSLGEPFLSTHNSNPFNKMISIHRHLRLNIVISIQSFNQVLAPALRSSLNTFILFKCLNKKIKQTMAESLSGHLKPEQFLEYWDKSTTKPHDCFSIFLLNDDGKKYSMNIGKKYFV